MKSKKLISFVFPQKIEEGKTGLGQKYEINFENGQKVLNSENTNYSFGSLHQIMLKGLDEVFRSHKPEKILMLGLGAGSALSVLKRKCKWNYHVTVVEIDAGLIDIARQHFGLDEYKNINLINMDARDAIKTLGENSFDLIIDDIFWDSDIPGFCMESEYLSQNKKLLKGNAVYMRNTMKTDAMDHKAYEKTLSGVFPMYYSLKHPDYGNKIYFCQGIATDK